MIQSPRASCYLVRAMRRLSPAAAALPAILLGGCGFLSSLIQPLVEISAGSWYRVGPVRRDLAELTTLTRNLVVRQGFKIPRFNPRNGLIETDWKVQLSPHFREGNRTKIEVVFHPDPDGSTLIRIRSYREINENSEIPMNSNKVEWVGASLDEKQAGRMNEPSMKLQQTLKLKLFGLRRD